MTVDVLLCAHFAGDVMSSHTAHVQDTWSDNVAPSAAPCDVSYSVGGGCERLLSTCFMTPYDCNFIHMLLLLPSWKQSQANR